ncbi:hypothetical protein [Nocardia thraciensis]
MGKVVKLVAGVLLGLFVLAGGVITLTLSEVKCGAEVMSPGDRCEETSRSGSVEYRSYEEQKRSKNTTAGWVTIGVGSLILVASGVGMTRRLTSGRQRQTPPAPQQSRVG